MPGILTGKLPHIVTLWALSGKDGFGGDTFSPPVTIEARWEERQEIFYGQLDRRELVSKAVVFLGQDVSVGDYLCLGDQTANESPVGVAGASKVQRFDRNTDLRGLDYVRRAVL